MARNPLTAVPATRSSLPMLKIRRRLVVGVLGLSVLGGFGSSIAWLTSDTTPPPPVTLPDQSAVSLAETVARDFLAARKSSVPAVKEVNNDFSKSDSLDAPAKPFDVKALTFAGSSPFTLGDGQRGPQLLTEQETFHAVVGGRIYAVTVPMVKAGSTWLLGAAPSITPANLGPDQTAGGIDYSELYAEGAGSESLLPPGYTEQIAKWASIYAKAGQADGDLLAITDDVSAEQHTYSGLGGWSVVGAPTIGSVVKVATPYPGFIVRVGLVLRAPGANGPTLSADYDLYLRSDRNPTQPPVVAWGPAGSYKSLQPYINADARVGADPSPQIPKE